MRSRNDAAESMAVAMSRSSVVRKYRYTVWRVTPSSRATSEMPASAPWRSMQVRVRVEDPSDRVLVARWQVA